jgi:hypothetical protein
MRSQNKVNGFIMEISSFSLSHLPALSSVHSFRLWNDLSDFD